MGRMRSLLNRSLLWYIGCTLVILLVCTPLFYLLTRHFYAEELIDLIHGSGIDAEKISDMDLEEDIMAGVMIQFSLIAAVLGVSSIITLRIISKRLWAPFKDTLEKIQTYNIDDRQIPVFAKSSTAEFNALDSCVSQLMLRSSDRYRQQKEFTENASHELQTPIAIIQSKMDLLIQEGLDERQSKLVQEAYDESAQMARLNRNLLLLAKIENNQFEEKAEIDIRSIVSDNILQMRELFGVTDEMGKIAGDCSVYANGYLTETLVRNLIVNAFRHTPAGGEINVNINGGGFSISNTAKDGPLDANRIFERFNHSSDPDRGNGIGLAIVKAICGYSGWSVVYAFENNMHVFKVNFTSAS